MLCFVTVRLFALDAFLIATSGFVEVLRHLVTVGRLLVQIKSLLHAVGPAAEKVAKETSFQSLVSFTFVLFRFLDE